MWDIILTKDDESCAYLDLQARSGGHINIEDYGKVLKSGWGEWPTRQRTCIYHTALSGWISHLTVSDYSHAKHSNMVVHAHTNFALYFIL